MSEALETGRMIEAIYEAAVMPEQWPSVLDGIARATGFAGGSLTAVPPIRRDVLSKAAPRMRWVASPRIVDVVDRYFVEGWYKDCGWSRRGLKLGHPGFVIDTDMFTPDEIDAEPSYRFFRRNGIGGAASLFLRVPPSDTFVFSFDRWLSDGPVTPHMVAQLEPLRSHLSRAALMSSRLGLERAFAATQALAILGLPAAVLCPRHRVLSANDLLQALMPSRVEERAHGRFHLADPRADALLTRALDMALVSGADHDPQNVFSIPMAARGDHPAMVVHLVPIRRAARDIFASAASILLITPVSARELPAASVIQGLFDLTAAETRVAQMIAHGETVDTIATRAQVSQATVRSHLKAVFSKTGVSRQASLAILLSSTSIRVEPGSE